MGEELKKEGLVFNPSLSESKPAVVLPPIKMHEFGITVDTARKNLIYQTSVLEPYKNGMMFSITKRGSGNMKKSVFRLESGSITIIFKAISCSSMNTEDIRQIQDELDLSIKAYKIAQDGIVVPISYEETTNKDLNEYIMEIVYEYGGDNILTALKDATGQEVMDAMGTLAKTMSRLESNKIFHSDIKPKNIVIMKFIYLLTSVDCRLIDKR